MLDNIPYIKHRWTMVHNQGVGMRIDRTKILFVLLASLLLAFAGCNVEPEAEEEETAPYVNEGVAGNRVILTLDKVYSAQVADSYGSHYRFGTEPTISRHYTLAISSATVRLYLSIAHTLDITTPLWSDSCLGLCVLDLGVLDIDTDYVIDVIPESGVGTGFTIEVY